MAAPPFMKAVPYSGPDAPPTVLMRVRPAVRSGRPGTRAVVVGLGDAGIERRDDRREPAIHVDAVVAIADGLVEGGQGRCLVVEPLSRQAEPAFERVEHRKITSE